MNYELIIAASVQKLGNTLEENQDSLALHPHKLGIIRLNQLFCAVADGVTRASFSGIWSKLLTEAAINRKVVPSTKVMSQIINSCSDEWVRIVGEKDLPWFAIEKMKKGSNATLLWLSLRISQNKEFANLKALAFGDCQLMIIRNGNLSFVYPMEHSSQFDSTPMSISTKYKTDFSKTKRVSKKVEPGDEIIIASDAVACFLMGELEKGENPLVSLESLVKISENFEEAFSLWISDFRKSNEIRNDDSTMIWIRLHN